MRATIAAVLLTIVAATSAGCGFRQPTAQVTGTVTFEGEPIEQGTIVFEGKDLRPATGKIENGKIIDCFTHDPGDGVPVGKHKVAIQATNTGGSAVVSSPEEKTSTDYMGGGESLIPDRYTNPATSGLTATVTSSGPNEFEFKLTK